MSQTCLPQATARRTLCQQALPSPRPSSSTPVWLAPTTPVLKHFWHPQRAEQKQGLSQWKRPQALPSQFISSPGESEECDGWAEALKGEPRTRREWKTTRSR